MKLRHLVVAGIVALACAPVVGSATAGAQAEGSVSIRLAEVPVDQADDPRANRYIVGNVDPGGSITRTVEVRNGTTSPTSVSLYAGAAAIVGDEFTFANGRGGNDLAGWTTVSPSTLELGPGATGSAVVTVDVPKGAGGGEHYGVVWAELPGSDAGAVTTVNRVGVRMYLAVGGEAPAWDFEIRSLAASRGADGEPMVEITVANTGTGAVDLVGELHFADGPGGVTAGPFALEGPTLAPDDGGVVTATLPSDFPAGPWTATATLRSGNVERTASASIEFPDEAGRAGPVIATAETAPEPVTTGSRTPPAAVAAALVAGMSALGGTSLVIRGRMLRRRG